MTIAARLARVRARIEVAARAAARDPAEVELVVVTKKRTADEVREAVAAGAERLGENYVQEALAKRAGLADVGATWHMIGPLQKNKAKYLPGHIDVVETIDGAPLAEVLSRRAAAAGATLEVLVQVNVGRESQKAGCAPEELEALLRSVGALEGLELRGLMAIPPVVDDPDEARPYFRELSRLARDAAARGLLPERPVLSMGMSDDFEVAIAEGATRVRVGTAIFGPRPASAS